MTSILNDPYLETYLPRARRVSKPTNFQRKVLLTGWSGFLGRHVFDRLCDQMGPGDHLYCLGRGPALAGDTLLETKAKVTFLSCDLGDGAALAGVLHNIPRLTHVIHLAAVSTQDADPFETARVNLGGTANLAAVVEPYTKFLFVSSAAVFGDRLRDAPGEYDPHQPTTLYGLTKSLCETQLSTVMKRLTIIRPVALCGPGATHGVVADVWRKVTDASAVVELIGAEPGTVKPFLLVTDVAEEVVRLAWNSSDRVYHFAPDDCVSVKALAEVAFKVAGVRKPVRWLGEKSLYRGDNKLVRLRPSPHPVQKFRPSLDALEVAFQCLRDSE